MLGKRLACEVLIPSVVLTGTAFVWVAIFFFGHLETKRRNERKEIAFQEAPIKTALPVGASSIDNLGNRWFYFELDGSCMIIKDAARASVLAEVACRK